MIPNSKRFFGLATVFCAAVCLWGATADLYAITVPTDMSGNVLWLDATDGSTVGTNGLGQFQWADKSGIGNNFVQTNSTLVPAWGTQTLNGLNVFTFDGVDDYLAGPAVLGYDDDTYTYYAVWQSTDPGRLASIYEQATPGVTGARSAILMISGSYGFNGQNNDAHTILPVGTDWHVTGLQIDNTNPANTNVTLYDNSVTKIARTGNPAGLAVGDAGGTIGKKYNPSEGEYHQGNLAEIIVYDRTLDLSEQTEVIDYLAGKYNFTLAPPEPPAQTMVHQWTFNDGAGLDEIGTADSTQFFGNATVSGGQLRLDGSGDYVLTARMDETLSARTIMAWVSMNDLNQAVGAGVFGLQATHPDGTPYDDFNSIVYAERQPKQWMNGSSGWGHSVPDNGGAQETSNDEIMLAIVYGYDNSITIYRNGVQYNTLNASQGGLNTYLQNQTIGVFGRRVSMAGPELNASINEARVYNYPLSATEIADVYAAGIEQPGLIHQWTFNDDATDSIGSADATLFSGAAIVDGKLVLDGIDDYGRTALLEDTVRERTMVAWVQLDNLTQKSGAAVTIERPGQNPGDTFDAIVYAERANGQWMAGSNGWTRTPPNNGGAGETSTDMVMLAISYAADGRITIYRDDQLYATYVSGAPITYWDLEHGASDILFGLRSEDLLAYPNGTPAGDDGYLAGQIDEARLYNYALSLSDIQAIFAEGPVPVPEPSGLILLSLGLLALVALRRR